VSLSLHSLFFSFFFFGGGTLCTPDTLPVNASQPSLRRPQRLWLYQEAAMEAGSACLLAAAPFLQSAGTPDPRDRRRLRWALAEQALFRPHSVSRSHTTGAHRSQPPRALTAEAGRSRSVL
jgi:hypothetical protein